MRARGPRCGVEVVAESLRRLELVFLGLDVGRRENGAAGASDLRVDHRPTVWSAEAERTREEGAWVARSSILALWP